MSKYNDIFIQNNLEKNTDEIKEYLKKRSINTDEDAPEVERKFSPEQLMNRLQSLRDYLDSNLKPTLKLDTLQGINKGIKIIEDSRAQFADDIAKNYHEVVDNMAAGSERENLSTIYNRARIELDFILVELNFKRELLKFKRQYLRPMEKNFSKPLKKADIENLSAAFKQIARDWDKKNEEFELFDEYAEKLDYKNTDSIYELHASINDELSAIRNKLGELDDEFDKEETDNKISFSQINSEVADVLTDSKVNYEAQTAPAPPEVPFVKVGSDRFLSAHKYPALLPENHYLPKVKNIHSSEDENLILDYLKENIYAFKNIRLEYENKKLVGYIKVSLPSHNETKEFRVTGDFAAKIKQLYDGQIKLRGFPYAGSVGNKTVLYEAKKFVDKFIFIETEEQKEKLLNIIQSEIEKKDKSMSEFIDLSRISVISSTTPDNKVETFYSIKLNLDDNGFKTYNVPEKTLEEIKSLMEKRRLKIHSKIFKTSKPLVVNQENENQLELVSIAEITQNLTQTLEPLIARVEPIEEGKMKGEALSALRIAMIGDGVTLTLEQQETEDQRRSLVSNILSRDQNKSRLAVDKKKKKLPAKALLYLSGACILIGVIWYSARYVPNFDKIKPDKVTKKAEPPQPMPPEAPSQPIPDQPSAEDQSYLSYEPPVEDVPAGNPNEGQNSTPEKIDMHKYDPNVLTIPEVGKSSEEDLINFQRALNEQAKKIRSAQNTDQPSSTNEPTNEGNNNIEPKK